jgi:hypothetical protein
MEVTNRVHIVAHGWEVARIVEPLFELKADKVVLVVPSDESLLADFEHEMIADLESMDRLNVELRPANRYDLDNTLQVFTQAVKDHEDDEVFINVSTGSSIAIIAGMMATQTSDATAFHVEPDFPGERSAPETPLFDEAGDISELQVFKLQGPSSEQLRVLARLHGTDGLTKKELIAFTQEEELPFIANTEAKSDEGLYRLLDSHVIEPLSQGNYIRVQKAGRKKEVYLTQRGRDTLAAFPLDSATLETFETSVPKAYSNTDGRGGVGSVRPADAVTWLPSGGSQGQDGGAEDDSKE